MADSTVRIGADLSELRRELAKLPNMSGEAAQKTLIKVEKAVQKAERAAKQSTKAISRAQKEAARAAEKSTRDAGEGFKALYELAGGSGDQLEKLTKLFEGLGAESAAALSTALGFSAAIVGIGAAAVAAAVGVVGLVRLAGELTDELEQVQKLSGVEIISPSQLASVQAANDALDSVKIAVSAAAVSLGAEFAPVVERAARLTLMLGLATADAINSWTNNGDALQDVAVFFAVHLVKAITTPIRVMLKLAGLIGELSRMAGLTDVADKIDNIRQTYEDTVQSIAETAVDFYFDKAADAVDDLGARFEEYGDKADALIETQTKLREQTEDTSKADEEAAEAAAKRAAELERLAAAAAAAKRAADLEQMAKSMEDLVTSETAHRLSAAEKIDASERQAIERLSELTEARMAASVTDSEIVQAYIDGQQRRTELEEEFSQRRIELAEQEAAQKKALALSEWGTYADVAGSSLSAISQMSSAVHKIRIDQFGEGTKAAKKAAARQFKIQKALALATIVVQTTQAVMQALGSSPPPLSFINAGIAATAGTAQLAIAASVKPPALHTGGMVGRAAPDEVDRRVLTTESVLSPRATQMLGEQTINNLNAGGTGGGGSTVVVVEYKNQVLDTQVSDLSRVPGSALRRAIKQGARVGHRTR